MANLDYFYPFDSVDGDRKTTAATERRFWGGLFTDGVVGAGGFPLTGSGGVYSVGAGLAVIGGAVGGMTAARSVAAKPAAGVKMYIVLRLDTTAAVRSMALEVVSAPESATDAQLENGGVRDLPLYAVEGLTGGGYGILDLREYSGTFEADVFRNKFEAMTANVKAEGEAALAALRQQFEAVVNAADAENAGMYGAAGRQGFMNPTFTVNQRGKESYGLTSGSAYTFDRWKAVVSGKALASAMLMQTEQDGQRHALRIDTKAFAESTAAAGRAGVVQNIEGGVRTFCAGGRQFTVSFDAKASAACKMGIDAKEFTESGGVGVDQGQAVDLTTEWQRFSVTFTGTATPTAAQVRDVLQVGFWVQFLGYTRYGADQAGGHTVWLANMQVNEGTAALPCYAKPYAEELEACQRYYAAFGYTSLSCGATLATTSQAMSSPLPLPRRLWRKPDVTATDRTSAAGVASAEAEAGGWRNGLAFTVSDQSAENPVFVVKNTDATGLTRIVFNSVTVDAEIMD